MSIWHDPNAFPSKIRAPFTDEQIAELNARQHSGKFHPYTCGGNRTDEKHLDGQGLLVATKDGWICPYCDYKQDWAINIVVI